MDIRDLQIAILAGGLGTRLRSACPDHPKVLAPVAGRPFLAYLLDQVALAGATDVLLLTGHQGDLVQRLFGASYQGLQLTYSREPAPRGTAGALAQARPLLRASTLLLLNGDSYFDIDLDVLHRFHTCHQSQVSLALKHVDDTQRYGAVRLTRRQQVIDFLEKDAAGGPGWINGGVYLLEPALIAAIPQHRPVSLEREILPAWVARGQVFGLPASGPFLDIGTPESYARAETFFQLAQGALEHAR
ncbi:MAG: sugar phosphate nucleotidyltransferase [Gemmataceae bacterium]